MRYSKLLLPTLREIPADCDNVSQALMMRGAMLKKVSGGLFVYLPYFNMVLEKVKEEIRRGMNKANSSECKFPILVAKDDLVASGRWDAFGKEMFRLFDRNDKEYAISPTNEEYACFMAENFAKSYNDLPLSVYQIQQKHRDEIRPKGGVMRAREFYMKDAYSFHKDEKDLDDYYNLMREVYFEIFRNLGLKVVSVGADSGAMGGSGSEEIMAICESGESLIGVCEGCTYAANAETIPCKPIQRALDESLKQEKIYTPSSSTIEELTSFLKVPKEYFVKTMLYRADEDIVAVLIRGDREVNEVKLKKYLSCQSLELASEKDVNERTNSVIGFIGPIGLKGIKKLIADFEIGGMNDFVVGANERDYHIKNVNNGDFNAEYADIRFADESSICPVCGKKLKFYKANELGHIFKLGKRYTDKLDIKYIDSDGKAKTMVMGCYGIGLERTVASIIEQHHDDKGMILPIEVAPFKVNVIAVDVTSEKQYEVAEKIYNTLIENNIDTLFDDRKARAGVKFNDSDLLGIPVKVIVGKNIEDGNVEIQSRLGNKELVGMENFLVKIKKFIEADYGIQ